MTSLLVGKRPLFPKAWLVMRVSCVLVRVASSHCCTLGLLASVCTMRELSFGSSGQVLAVNMSSAVVFVQRPVLVPTVLIRYMLVSYVA